MHTQFFYITFTVLVFNSITGVFGAPLQLSSNVQFCTPTLTLAVGDSFNMRDLVVATDSPSTPVDWPKVTFFYSDSNLTTWHQDDFIAGRTIRVGPGDVTYDLGAYELYVQGTQVAPSMCRISVWPSPSESHLMEALTDPLCGMARGSLLSEVILNEPNVTLPPNTSPSPTPQPNRIKFCVYSLTLCPNDVLNIRDVVVNQVDPAKKIDWTKVVFYYTDGATWHMNDFSAGRPFMIRPSDFGKGNRAPNQFQVALRDLSGSDSTLNIILSTNTTLSQAVKLTRSSKCGFVRDELPINILERAYPAITTVTFDYEGPVVNGIASTVGTGNISSMAGYIADLLGLQQAWVQKCPQQRLGTECIQFVDSPIDGTGIDTTLWASRLLQYVNHPSVNDTRSKEWTRFSTANVTGRSSLNNFQPLSFEDADAAAAKAAASLSTGLVVILILVILSIGTIIGVFLYKLRTRVKHV